MLRQKTKDPLPICQLRVLHSNDDIRAWFLANNGHDRLELIVLELRRKHEDDLDESPEPPNGRYPFLTVMSGMTLLGSINRD